MHFSENEAAFKLRVPSHDDTSHKERTLKGLLPGLRRAFWPTYKYVRSRFGGSTGVRSAHAGRRRGTTVHSQLESYANETDFEVFVSRHPALHPYAKKAIKALEIWKLEPIRAELAIADPILMIGTAIDMVCVDEEGRLVIIEWKCGMDHYMMRGTASMRGPLGAFYSNSPLNQAYFQLLFERAILQYHYGVVPAKAYVVQIEMDDIMPYPLPEELIRKQGVLYDYFTQCVIK